MIERSNTYTIFRSYTPDGVLWCETHDPIEFLEQNALWNGPGHLTSQKSIASRNAQLMKG